VRRGQGSYPSLGSANSAWRAPTRPGRRPHRQRRYIALDRWPDSTPSARHCTRWAALGRRMISPVKRCRRCGETKRREAFGANRRHRDGLHSWCRSCLAAWKRRWRAGEPRGVQHQAPAPAADMRHLRPEFTPVRVDQGYCCRWCREHRYLIGLPATPLSRWSEITRRVANLHVVLRHRPPSAPLSLFVQCSSRDLSPSRCCSHAKAELDRPNAVTPGGRDT
jgi:hypothetical protein